MSITRKPYLPSIADMLFLSLFLYLALVKGSDLLRDCDTGYHIRAGEWILAHRAIPRLDMFSFITPPLPWTAHEWLSEVIMALIHNSFGLTGISVFFAGILALVSALLFRMVRQHGGSLLVSVGVTLLATIASQLHWLARPHVFSLLLFLIWLWILENYRQGISNRLILLPPVLLLWVNLHGGYLAGFMLLGIYFLGELPACWSAADEHKQSARRRAKQLAMVTLVCLPVSCINPYGWHILLFPFSLVGNKVIMDNVVEFMSPNFHEPSPFKYLLLLLLAALALFRERLQTIELLLLLVFLNMSLYSVRYIPLFAIATAPLLVGTLDRLMGESKHPLARFLTARSENLSKVDSEAGGIFWPIAACALVIGIIASGQVRFGFDPKTKPVAAVLFIEQARIPGNMFNNDEFGDYVIYAAWPRQKVFFDGRSDMYGAVRMGEYMKLSSFHTGWEKLIESYKINWIFFDTDSQLVRYLKQREDWVQIYEDKVAAIFVRNTPQNHQLIKRYGRDLTPNIAVPDERKKPS